MIGYTPAEQAIRAKLALPSATGAEDPGHAADMALDGDWTRAGEVFHCPDCPPLDVDEDKEVTA